MGIVNVINVRGELLVSLLITGVGRDINLADYRLDVQYKKNNLQTQHLL